MGITVDNLQKNEDNKLAMEKQLIFDAQRLADYISANEAYVKEHYPDDKFISNFAEIKGSYKYSKGLIIPENVKVTEARIPINREQREILRKELRQAEILAKLGCSVYLIPERAAYGIKPKDAVVNGLLYEFRTVTGNANTFQWEFRHAKRKGADTNVYINVLSKVISKEEARRRIWLVLRQHSKYTGEIIISFDNGSKTYLWDSDSFR